MQRIRLSPNTQRQEQRLQKLLGSEPGTHTALLRGVVQDAQVLGSLELAGFEFTWDDVRGVRRTGTGPESILGLQRALESVETDAPFSAAALHVWHAAALDETGSAFRQQPAERADGPPPAPPGFVESRVDSLVSWLGVESGRQLTAAQAGALTLARLVEIQPFDQANGRVARLAASHVMVRAGARPPILAGAERDRLEATLRAAFQLHTEPLATLLEEAAERPLSVMVQTLEAEARTDSAAPG